MWRTQLALGARCARCSCPFVPYLLPWFPSQSVFPVAGVCSESTYRSITDTGMSAHYKARRLRSGDSGVESALRQASQLRGSGQGGHARDTGNISRYGNLGVRTWVLSPAI